MKEKVLKILKEADSFVSGESLSKHMGVSRTAIWKVISGLKKEGYEIESATRKGYRLMNNPDLITSEELQYQLKTKYIGKQINYYPTVGSTNQEAKNLANQGAAEGTVIIAEQQTDGKGRRGKTWVSPAGTGIWMSCILRPAISPVDAPFITLIAGLAVSKAINKATNLETRIKWPNDVVLNGKKVCGILTEMNGEMEEIHYLVLGMGINVNTAEFPDDIKKIATSLLIEGKKRYKRKYIVQEILRQFETYYTTFLETGSFDNLLEDYESLCVTLHQEVKVIKPGEIFHGKASGLNNKGELIVQKENGETLQVRSGEVSVRGLYGYI